MNDSRLACPSCGALNGAAAQFCGQCFAAMSGAPAGSATAATGSIRGMSGSSPRGAQPAWTPPSASPSHPGGMPVVGAGNIALKIVLALVLLVAGWGVQWYIRYRPHTVEAKDGTFSVTYSSYWDEMDMEGMPPVPGFAPDLAVENESSGVLIMHMPVPPGAEESLMKGFNHSQLEQVISTSPWPGQLESSMSPGTTTLGGKKVALEAKATVEFEGESGKLDLLVGLNPDETIMLMVLHGCIVEECPTSDSEFKDVLDSLEFAPSGQGAL